MPLSPEQIGFYRINVALLVGNLLHREVLDPVRRKMDEYADRSRTVGQ